MRLFYLLFLLFSTRNHTQILERYPTDQLPYTGGEVALYQDFNQL